MLKFLKSIFDFRAQKKQLLHIVLVTFFISFAVARLWSIIVGNSFYFKGYQIHHFYFGTLALVAGGLMGILSESAKKLRIASALIGIGMGLFADEIGLLLNCTTSQRACFYAFPDTFDIIGTIGLGIFLLLVIIDYAEKIRIRKQPQDK